MKANRHSLPSGFRGDLKRVFEIDAPGYFSIEALKSLEHALETWSKDCDKELKTELAKLPKDHPVRCPISLFGTMVLGRLEVAHTKTLAWLLNPKGEHGFGDVLLKVLLQRLRKRTLPPLGDVEVMTEWFYRDSDEEDAGRLDIRVQGCWNMRTKKKPWLVVIEAKVGAPADEGQLGCYANMLGKRKDEGAEVYSVFLTVDGELPKGAGRGWVALSFFELARVFLSAMPQLRTKPHYPFFRYYMAGILKDILDLPIGDVINQDSRYKLLGFLHEAERTQLRRTN